MAKTRIIGGVPVTIPDDERLDDIDDIIIPDENSSEEQSSSYVKDKGEFKSISSSSGARQYFPLTPREEREIGEDLQLLAKAIVCYSEEDSCSEILIEKFVNFYVELELAKKDGSLTG
ncbi:MAG: hypothetical protein COS89_02910 [Deltaproteobacteria bacterium CG07_land_8_20_14_0_80_38_7]|nr:MAG: hypothetical protein COS89_02910 [Deltaproteobacteria bacterium CG07_land_8_20_14_0_80_38_7]